MSFGCYACGRTKCGKKNRWLCTREGCDNWIHCFCAGGSEAAIPAPRDFLCLECDRRKGLGDNDVIDDNLVRGWMTPVVAEMVSRARLGVPLQKTSESPSPGPLAGAGGTSVRSPRAMQIRQAGLVAAALTVTFGAAFAPDSVHVLMTMMGSDPTQAASPALAAFRARVKKALVRCTPSDVNVTVETPCTPWEAQAPKVLEDPLTVGVFVDYAQGISPYDVVALVRKGWFLCLVDNRRVYATIGDVVDRSHVTLHLDARLRIAPRGGTTCFIPRTWLHPRVTPPTSPPKRLVVMTSYGETGHHAAGAVIGAVAALSHVRNTVVTL